MKRRAQFLAIALNASAPLSLATLHESLTGSILTALVLLPLGVSLYIFLKGGWPELGLYDVVKDSRLGNLQLISWFASYFLYLSYTIDYAVFYDFPGGALVRYATLVLLLVMTSTLLLQRFQGILIPLAALQVILVFFGWHASFPGVSLPNFTDLLNSSLLLVCVTLIPYLKVERGSASIIPLSLVTGLLFLTIGSFLETNNSDLYQGVSMLGLVALEAIAVGRVSKAMRIRGEWAVGAFLGTSLISLISPLTYYNLTIAPSVFLLYLSLLIAFVSMKLRGYFRLFSLVTAVVMGYGLYQSVVVGDPTQVLEIAVGFLLVVVFSLLLGTRWVRGS
ncbi:hypothetical protein GWK48_07590 [Metallosphaera tengchongensis]|uniref:Uncharacterized protein n=1 Tax=Metallosphaera tengchongensis TaxID=1532350 RepID=A0A6N0NU01_9CREN|nr:hypothetical protein [Metallosphaera tengchongensis]QKR00256.1 hypothetical protein GWK48_07590 [Metallosphaera tengchongensis]